MHAILTKFFARRRGKIDAFACAPPTRTICAAAAHPVVLAAYSTRASQLNTKMIIDARECLTLITICMECE
jgi:hypothetical protein